ncbi:MAG: YqaE/Pmp3 family membrane protein [Anaerolineae bacterium]
MRMQEREKSQSRTCLLVVLSFVFPPLAVLERGCSAVLLVSVLTVAGWFPGALVALFMTLTNAPSKQRRYIQIPLRENGQDEDDSYADDVEADEFETKRKGAYIRLADGEVAEVVEEEEMRRSEKRKRGL